jgi:hypothetical protein
MDDVVIEIRLRAPDPGRDQFRTEVIPFRLGNHVARGPAPLVDIAKVIGGCAIRIDPAHQFAIAVVAKRRDRSVLVDLSEVILPVVGVGRASARG